MQIRVFPPHAALAHAVENHCLLEIGAHPGATAMRVAPSLNIGLCLHYGGHVEQAYRGAVEHGPSSLTGYYLSPRHYVSRRRIGVVLTNFRAGAVSQFFDVQPGDLLHLNVRLSDLLRPLDVERIEGELAEAGSDEARVALVTRFLLGLRARRGADDLARHAADELRRHGGQLPIAELAARVGLSVSQLERRFAREIGVSPKKYARLARFHRMLQQAPHAHSSADLAAAAGYFDQSHLIKECLAFAETTPSACTPPALITPYAA